MKGATLFSGFEGAGTGMKEAGITHAWGIESDPAIAGVARRNGFDVTISDILDCDPSLFPAVGLLHASPPCPPFSVANANGKESEHDVAMARKVAQFVDVIRPRIFTLENVYMYRRSASWEIIRNTLYECGYWMDLAHVNAADFGVPQTRKRMIVRAVHGAMVPYLPAAEPWRGWYEAIEDLIPQLPDSQFAPWQNARLAGSPITALFSQGMSRDADGKDYGNVLLRKSSESEPAFTITANRNMMGVRAFLVSGGQGDYEGGTQYITQRDSEEPAFTVTASETRRPTRAFLVGDQERQLRRADEPSFTVRAGTNGGASPRAWLDYGRVVQMTPRALARFQSFPDWYELPDSKTLACRGTGNACPPLLMQRIYEGLVR